MTFTRAFLGCAAGAAVLACSVAPALARELAPAPRISVLTFGPGDEAFSKFGHDAILVESGTRSLVYNFGTFRFDSPWLIPEFLKGRLHYWLSVSSLDATIAAYQERNRSILQQELRLSLDERRSIAARLERNALPEHRSYAYDYYRDNCATRVRDVLDQTLGGALSRAAQAPAALTYRQHTLRLVADDLPLYVGLHLGLAGAADRSLTRWEEAFLPEQLAAIVRSTTRSAPAGPLVTRERVIFAAQREPDRSAPPEREGAALATGLLMGSALAGLGRAAARSARALKLFAGVLGVLGVLGGAIGSLLSFFWLATNHQIAYANENTLLMPPWALALGLVAIPVARQKPRANKALFVVAAACAASGVANLVFKALPWSRQDNTFFLALMVPLWLGAALGAWWVQRRSGRRRSGADTS
jgi:hypothetical protein